LDLAYETHQLVEQFARRSFEERRGTCIVETLCLHDGISGCMKPQHFRYQRSRMLPVAIHGNNDVCGSCIQTCAERCLMPEVSTQVNY
jgi:hypothetical protein